MGSGPGLGFGELEPRGCGLEELELAFVFGVLSSRSQSELVASE